MTHPHRARLGCGTHPQRARLGYGLAWVSWTCLCYTSRVLYEGFLIFHAKTIGLIRGSLGKDETFGRRAKVGVALVLVVIWVKCHDKLEKTHRGPSSIDDEKRILVDFIVERPEEESPDELMAEPEELSEPWTLFTDGSSCINGSGAGMILTNPEGVEFTYAMRFRFEATDNEAEYEALIAGLRIAEQMGIKNLQANVDSRLVASQVNGSYVAKESGKSINEKEVLAIVEEEGHTWMTPICEYLTKEVLSEDKKKAMVVRRKASRYAVINGTLYKKSFLGPWLWCVGPLQENYILREIHEGSYIMHSGPRSVATKAIQTGYYWPTMHTDARKLIRIEAKPIATIIGNQVKKFVWDNIVCRFGLSGEIVSDNGKQFCDNPFKDWCEKLCICHCFASLKHPQTNGLVKRANKSLREGIKARLDERSKDWIGELSHVIWAHRTLIKSSNGETPFSLTYGTEAVIPAEIGMPTLWTTEVDLIKNDEALEINLDLIEEKREQAAIQEAKSKAKMERYYNFKVCGTSFKSGGHGLP
ncbi:reverse transcriptase domain-containing protein [Tanacetum coccineum]|uniref:Reverse transcriptase domain-containing protein n=1 Tax=Tanacetum coccineum TaxID=301880 RepID=A0ABQ4ZLK0_9ASTR